jgi:hypothetical protein
VREFVHGGLEYHATMEKLHALERQLQLLAEEKVLHSETCDIRQKTKLLVSDNMVKKKRKGR